MIRIWLVVSVFGVFGATTLLAQGALAMAMLGVVLGFGSVIALIFKIHDLERITNRQQDAVETLDELVIKLETTVIEKTMDKEV